MYIIERIGKDRAGCSQWICGWVQALLGRLSGKTWHYNSTILAEEARPWDSNVHWTLNDSFQKRVCSLSRKWSYICWQNWCGSSAAFSFQNHLIDYYQTVLRWWPIHSHAVSAHVNNRHDDAVIRIVNYQSEVPMEPSRWGQNKRKMERYDIPDWSCRVMTRTAGYHPTCCITHKTITSWFSEEGGAIAEEGATEGGRVAGWNGDWEWSTCGWLGTCVTARALQSNELHESEDVSVEVASTSIGGEGTPWQCTKE